ncbi:MULTISPECIES: DUF2510 domain-containing protein [unclassified Cryobacterium]|uniref:DUF2510 domain-containing protein n=1 Tax=unclassified Cryobacterium TaxID=2649013 RepID=UPI00144756D9|nr:MULTISPECIES: DUF2510 domain-containing protein [unclassified Cryobacterium]
MTESTTALPPAGWYPDPEGGDRKRWWDGSGWTDQLQAPPVSAPRPLWADDSYVPPEEPVSFTIPEAKPTIEPEPQRWQRGPAVRTPIVPVAVKNTPADVGFILALVGVVINPAGLLSLAALILGFVGLRRSGSARPPVGRGRSIWAIVLGAVGTVLGILSVVLLVALFANVNARASEQAARELSNNLKVSILTEMVSHGIDGDVVCPELPPTEPGSTFQCTAEHLGETLVFDVEVRENGEALWQSR